MRCRITFAKTDAMRFTGHLDLHRAWERSFRRARLPLAYSQGFSPHPKLNLAAARPLGFTSEHEVLDAWLSSDLSVDDIRQALDKALPPGIRILALEAVDEQLPALQVEADAAEFIITFLDAVPDLEERRKTLLEASSLLRRRRDKDYDLRPLIIELEPLTAEADGHARLRARLLAREGATGRPEELVTALGLDPLAVRVHRTRIIFQHRVK